LKYLYLIIGTNLRVVPRIVLLRHAHSIANEQGILAGRIPGISLSEKGRAQSQALAERLKGASITTISCSPLERCQETILPWLQSDNTLEFLNFSIEDRLNEVDYGSWSGLPLKKLSKDPLWKTIQERPSKVGFPEGERILGMQKRAVEAVKEISGSKKGTHLFISHGDVIKAIAAELLSMKLDTFQKLVIDPASITIFEIEGERVIMTTFNNTSGDLSALLSDTSTRKATLGGGAGLSKMSKKLAAKKLTGKKKSRKESGVRGAT
jgi:probable phosphomutase (TIGR03848 family)